MTSTRYITTVVSVGEAGLVARPAAVDTVGSAPSWPSRVVQVYRKGEDHLAEALAADLNQKETV